MTTHDLRAIYIIDTDPAGKVTGHYISFKGNRRIVHKFTHCRLDLVVEQASEVIHNPTIYNLTEER